jgi:hypothetical protein
MGLTRSQADAQLAGLYAAIPPIPDCGPIDMSDRERQRIRAAGTRITPYQQAMASPEQFWCDALTGGKRCAVYDLRPLLCRLWGAVEGMPCVYGCVPEGGYLTDVEAYRMIAESMRIGGGNYPDAGEVDAAMARQGLRAEMERIRAGGRAGEQRRATESIPAPFRHRLTR